jgi:hypothetical protein
MSQEHSGGIDQAALLVALLAVFFQVTNEPGPWSPINTAFGLILLLMIAAYAQPSLRRRVGPVYLPVLATAVGAGVSLCLVAAWPAQQTVVYGIAWATGFSTAGDDLGDYTTWYAFPIVLVVGTWIVYRFALRKLTAASAGVERPAGDATP